MNHSLLSFRTISAVVAALLCAGSLSAATIAAGSGTYTDTLPAGLTGPSSEMHRTANVTGALPTNEWWSSILFSTTPYRMYAYPSAYKCQVGWDPTSGSIRNGILIGFPDMMDAVDYEYYGTDAAAPYRQQLLVNGIYQVSGSSVDINAAAVNVDGYSDWSVTPEWRDRTDSTKYFKATFGQGMPYTYFDFGPGVNARIKFPLDWAWGQFLLYDHNGVQVLASNSVTDDRVTIVFEKYTTGEKVYYGVFAPAGTVFTLDNNGTWNTHIIDISFPSDSARYLSICPMNAISDLSTFYNYAYAFVTNTRVSWSVNDETAKVNTTFTATTQARQYGQTTTLMALFPHQKKNSTNSYLSQQYSTLRGTMSVVAANSFTVSNEVRGILPILPDQGDHDAAHLKALLATDKAMTMSSTGEYWHGKELMKIACLIPVASQTGDLSTRAELLTKLKSDLTSWFTYTPGETNRFFYYNAAWGSLLGYDNEYGSEKFNDQHFHFGMFVYASAILALYDPSFVEQYGDMVELLIRSYASPERSDSLFPFLRCFSPYEGHSWADGRALSDDGNNQESSSESMNSWAAIYLWGLATGNTAYRDLGIYGYTTEYSAIREYYFDVDDDQYHSPYTHTAIGILWGARADHATWFGSEPEDIHGIQMLPQTPSMLYLGYHTAYAQANYNEIVSENGGVENTWKDIIWKYQALFDPAAALAKYSESITPDSGDSMTALYQWLHFFSAAGTVDTSVYADTPAYGVFNRSGTRLYTCFNMSTASKTVRFYRRSDNALLGTVALAPCSLASTTDFDTIKRESLLRAPSGSQLVSRGLHTISFSWDANAAASFSVSRSSDGISWTSVATTTAAVFNDSVLRLATTWYYRVCAINSAGTVNPYPMTFSASTLMPASSVTVLSAASSGTQELSFPDAVLGRVVITIPAGSLNTDGTIAFNADADTVPQDAALADLAAATAALAAAKNTLVPGSISELHFYDLTGATMTTPFRLPVTLVMAYPDADGDGFIDGLSGIRASSLRVAVFDPATVTWTIVPGDQRVDTASRTVSCSISHFSIYALISVGSLSAADLSNVVVYPNPYKPGTGGAYDNTVLGKGMVFDHLTPSAHIRIYTVAGELVAEGEESDGDGQYLWNACNASGEAVASGVYIYYITGPAGSGQKAHGKLAVIR